MSGTFTLAIDTGSPRTFIGIKAPDGRIFERSPERVLSHNEDLACSVSDLMKDAGIKPAQIGRLVAGSGPGSFTGLRIGYAFMKGLAFSMRLPLLSLDSLRAAAWEHRESAGIVAGVADARRGEFFCGIFLSRDGKLKSLKGPLIASPAEIGRAVSALKEQYSEERALLCSVSGEQNVSGQDFSGEDREVFRDSGMTLSGSSRIAFSLLDPGCQEFAEIPDFSLARLAEMEPLYLRAVAAKSLVERGITLSRPV